MAVLLAGALLCELAPGATYTISNTAAKFGTVSFPCTFKGTLLSTYSVNDGYYDTFTFTPSQSGTQRVSISFSKLFGSNHSFTTKIYERGMTQVAKISNSGSSTVSFKAGVYYSVKVQMLNPSSYTTTKYSYALDIGSSGGGGSDGYYPAIGPTASDGAYQSYVRLTWSSVSGATSYRVLRSTSTKYSTATAIYTGSSCSYNDKSANLGKKYYYWVLYLKNGSWWKSEAKYNGGYRKMTLTAYYPTTISVGSTHTLRLAVNGSYVTSGVAVSPKNCSYWKINWYKTSPCFAKVKGLKAGTKSVKITYGKSVTVSITVPLKVVK